MRRVRQDSGSVRVHPGEVTFECISILFAGISGYTNVIAFMREQADALGTAWHGRLRPQWVMTQRATFTPSA